MSLRRWPFSLERLAARRFSSLLLARFSSSSDVSCCCQHTDSTGSHHIPSQSHAPVHRPHWLSAYTSINRLHWLSAHSLISHFSAQTTLALSVYQSIKRPHWLSVYLLIHFNQPATLAFSVTPHTLQANGHTSFQCNSSYISVNMPHWWESARNTNTSLHSMRFNFIFSWSGTNQLVERQGATGTAQIVVPNQQKTKNKKKRKKERSRRILTRVRFLGAASSLCLSVCLSLPPRANFRYTLAYSDGNSPG